MNLAQRAERSTTFLKANTTTSSSSISSTSTSTIESVTIPIVQQTSSTQSIQSTTATTSQTPIDQQQQKQRHFSKKYKPNDDGDPSDDDDDEEEVNQTRSQTSNIKSMSGSWLVPSSFGDDSIDRNNDDDPHYLQVKVRLKLVSLVLKIKQDFGVLFR